jgi:hypothetical protein
MLERLQAYRNKTRRRRPKYKTTPRVPQPSHDFPIGIRTYERPDYFDKMMSGLLSCYSIKPSLIHIFDDHSVNPSKKRLLEKYRSKGMHVHINDSRVGVFQNKKNLWKYLFERHPSDIICDFEDDILINKDIVRIINAYRGINDLGILSLYDRFSGKQGLKRVLHAGFAYRIINIITGPAWVVTRQAYERVKRKLTPTTNTYCGSDRIMRDWVHKVNLLVTVTDPSFTQHFGRLSMCCPERKVLPSAQNAQL